MERKPVLSFPIAPAHAVPILKCTLHLDRNADVCSYSFDPESDETHDQAAALAYDLGRSMGMVFGRIGGEGAGNAT